MTSTSLPAIVPILNVPGGRGTWGVACGPDTLATLADRPSAETVSAAAASVRVMGSMSAAPIDRKVRGVLSPSRAGDFMSCPLLFRYRTIDRLPEGSSPDAVRGTLVHQVLEEIFDLPAAERTPAAAHRLLEPAWRQLQQMSRQAREVAATLDEPAWLDSAHTVLDRWFTLEDPTRLEPADREVFVEATLDSGLSLRGIVDRLDETARRCPASGGLQDRRPLSPRGSSSRRCSSCASTR